MATFHVHLGGLYNFLVDHKLRELFEKDGTGVDEDGVIKERGLQREREYESRRSANTSEINPHEFH